jgi:hypothetical protein
MQIVNLCCFTCVDNIKNIKSRFLLGGLAAMLVILILATEIGSRLFMVNPNGLSIAQWAIAIGLGVTTIGVHYLVDNFVPTKIFNSLTQLLNAKSQALKAPSEEAFENYDQILDESIETDRESEGTAADNLI